MLSESLFCASPVLVIFLVGHKGSSYHHMIEIELISSF